MSKTIKTLMAIGAMIVLIIVTVIGYQMWLQSGALFRLEKFDRVKWLHEGRNYNVRECRPGAYMAHDIVVHVVKKGMSSGEVVALLGGPDPGNVRKIEYGLGMCVGLEEQSIRIIFDDAGKVVDADIRW